MTGPVSCGPPHRTAVVWSWRERYRAGNLHPSSIGARNPSPGEGEVNRSGPSSSAAHAMSEMPVSKSATSRFSVTPQAPDSRTESSFQRPPRPRGLGENRVEKAVVSAFRSAPYRLGLSVGCCCPGLGFSERVVGPDRGVLGPTPHLGRVQIQRISLAIARLTFRTSGWGYLVD